MMKASLVVNYESKVALFYTDPLEIVPEWASIDVELGEVYIGADDTRHQDIKLDEIDARIYERIKKENVLLLVRVCEDDAMNPLAVHEVPLILCQQI